MALVNTYNTKVNSNLEVIKQGPDTILYESVDSREYCNSGTVSFLLQNKGENCLLDAQVLLEIPVTISKDDGNNWGKLLHANEDLIAFREPFNVIKNTVFIYNGTSITAQPAIGNVVESIVFDSPDAVNKTSVGSMTDFPTHLNGGANYQRADKGRWDRIMYLQQAIAANNTTGNPIHTSILIPLQISPFKSARNTKWYGKMSNTLPYVNNCELQIQFFPNFNALGLEALYSGNEGATPGYSLTPREAKCKLKLRWYQLPQKMRLRDVYEIGHWSKDVIRSTSGKIISTSSATSSYSSSFIARIHQKPDAICIYAQSDLDDTRVDYQQAPFFKVDEITCQDPFLEVESVNITVDTQEGAFTTNVKGQYLRFLTKQNIITSCSLSDVCLKRNKNFVWLSSEQISSMTKIPAGVWSNSTIQVTATFKDAYAVKKDNNNLTKQRNYIPMMLLYSGHASLRVTRDSCEVIRNGITESQFQSISSGTGGGLTSGGGIKSAGGITGYRSRF